MIYIVVLTGFVVITQRRMEHIEHVYSNTQALDSTSQLVRPPIYIVK